MTPSLLEHINSGKTVEIDDLRFFYLDEGKGEEIILLLPGFLTTSYNYRKLASLLSNHYRVIALDFWELALAQDRMDHFLIGSKLIIWHLFWRKWLVTKRFMLWLSIMHFQFFVLLLRNMQTSINPYQF